MNKIFKVIWNPATGSYSVASETAKSRGKKSGRSKLLISALVVGGLLSSGAHAEVALDGGKSAEATPLSNGWIAIGFGAIATSAQTGPSGGSNTSSVAIGQSAFSGVGGTSLGFSSNASGERSVALGQATVATGSRAIAIGSAAQATKEYSLALGNSAHANGDYATAIGKDSEANCLHSLAIGQASEATKAGSVAMGYNSQSNGTGAVALGQDSFVSGNDSAALGNGARTSGNNSVALGAGALAAEDNVISVGNNTDQRKIVFVDKGIINKTSTDAVNGSQIFALSQSVANRLGGNASVNAADGTVNAPTYTISSGTYNNVGDALDAVNSTINTTNTAVTDLKDDSLLWDGTAFSAKHGTNTTSKITNVMAGSLSDTSTDAVNGSQLKATNDNVTTNTTNITNLTNDVADINTTITGLEDDALQWNGTAFSAKHGTNTTSKITNVMAGDLSDTSTDAVNGSQLKTTNDNVATNTTNITNLTNDVADINTTITGLEDDSLQWNGTAFSAKHGTSTTNKITNVMAGDLSDTSTDAVNGAQLKTTNDNVATNTTNITNLTDDVADINTTITGLEDDALQWNGTAFSAKHGTSTTNKIINVAAGTLSSSSTDAVNGGQLYGLSSSIANYLGGNASVDSSGVFTGPTYNIGGTDYDNVGEALAAIDSSVVASLGDALAWDAKTGTFTASHGGSASKITNVAAGSISKDSADAVNGGQLYDVSNSISDILGGGSTVNADGTINAPAYTIANTDYDNVGAFSAAHDGDTTSKITNVKAGNVAVDSTDAVNGSQLYATNVLINQNSDMINQLAGDTSTTYIEEHGAGVNYVRTNDTGLTFIDASAAGVGSTALGYNATASGENSLAIGRDSVSSIDSGIALGSGSTSDRVIVKGSRSGSVTENGVVIGYDTTDGELLGALSVGKDGESYRQIINVADGSEAHDVVTVRQLQNAIGSVASTPAKYFHSNSKEEDSLAVGTDSLAMGAKTVVNGDAGIGIGFGSLVVQDAINGIAIGSSARANHANSIAMGNGSQTTVGAQSNYTAYNMDAPQNSVGEFSVGSTNGQRQITNVAAGSQDTDAVNVGQLKVTDARVEINTTSINNLNNQVSNLDTRVTNIENGIGDIVTTGSTKYFKANTTGADANAQGADSVAIGSGSIAAADNSVALGTGSIADETNTISVGSSTNQRRITNVAAGKNDTDAVNVAQLKSSTEGGVRYSTNEDGTINYSTLNLGDGKGGTTQISNVSAAVNDHDAVNYAQLKQSIQDTNSYTDQKMVEMDNKVKGVEKKMSGGIASAMAMTGLPQAYTPGASMASIGGGTYNGESAVALGVSMVSANGRWVYKLQGSTNSQGEYSAALGAGIQW